jgi:hypothetical protein
MQQWNIAMKSGKFPRLENFASRLRRPLFVVAAGFAVVSAMAGSAPAGVTIDGSIAEWGVNINSLAGGAAPSGTTGFLFTNKNEYWNPGGGGQPYDAEWMGIAKGTGVNSNILYIAIISGQRPSYGQGNFGLGDIELTVTNGTTKTYGIETGGSQTGGNSVVEEGENGAYFTLDSNGYTVTPFETNYASGLVAGSLWLATPQSGTNWLGGVTSFDKYTQINPTWANANLASKVGTTDYVYTANTNLDGNNGTHSVIELALDLSLFGAGASLDKIHWGPACGNDFVELEPGIIVVQNVDVPEPASMAIWLIVGAALAFPRLRGRRPESTNVAA